MARRRVVLTRGKHGRLPVMELEGRRIGDSTAIIAALEAYQPEPPLYPADPAQKARALELEDFFDEQLAPQMRRLVWHHALQDTDAIADSLFGDRAPGRARFLRATAPAVRPFVRRDYGVSAESAEVAHGEVLAAMDRIEAELQPSGYLVGDRFSVADLTAAALFTPLIAPPIDRTCRPRSRPRCSPCATSSRRVPAVAGSTRCTSATAGWTRQRAVRHRPPERARARRARGVREQPAERLQPALPQPLDVGARRKAVAELELHHAVREGPDDARADDVTAAERPHRLGCRALARGDRRVVAVEVAHVDQAVDVRVHQRPLAPGGRHLRQRICRGAQRLGQRDALLAQARRR